MAQRVSVSKEIEALLESKADIESKLASLERQIYALEGNYLEDTHHLGNIIRGWDGYLSSRSGALKKMKFKDSDRWFSMSSVTSLKNLDSSDVSPNASGYEDNTPQHATPSGRPPKRQATYNDSSPNTPVSIPKGHRKVGPGRPRKQPEEYEDDVDV